MRVIEALKGILLTKTHVGLGSVDNTADADKPVSTAQAAADAAVAATAAGGVSTHAGLTAAHGATGAVVGTTNAQTLTNKTLTAPAITTPTGIVKGDVGLGSVDNTADTAKPVSTAQQTALDLKLTIPAGSNDDLLQRKSGLWVPRTIAQVKTDLTLVKGDVGLGNVDNTSDAAKPISTATQAALNTKVETVGGFGAIHVGPGGSLNLTVTADDANAGQSGFLSGSGYTKLESLALDNRVATGAPTINDDSADGYVVGSLWLNVTLDIAYVCLDATVGAAVWKRMQVWDADLDTIAGLTATSDSFMQAKGSAWSSRTVAQVRSDLTIALNNVAATSNPLATDDSVAGYGVGSFWLNTTTDRAYVCLDSTVAAAVWRMISLSPTLRLDYGAVADVVSGGTLTLTTWNNVGSAQAFTNGGSSGSWLYIEVLLGLIGQAAALTQWAARLTFDTGQSTYEFFTGLAMPSPNYGALNGHTFLVPNFLAAGSRTVTLQVMPLSSNVLAYCRPTANPNMEQFQVRIVEWIP